MPSLIYRNREASKWFVPATAVQAEDAAFEVHNLASGAGRMSANIDLGEGAVAGVYQYHGFVQWQTAPVVGQGVGIFLKFSGHSGSATAHSDNDDGTGEGAISAQDKLRNLYPLDFIEVDEAAINVEMGVSGIVEILARTVQVAFWNFSDDALTNDVDENGFILSPAPWELQ